MPQSREETALAPSAAKMRRSKICIVAAAFPHRKSGGRIGRKSRVSAWKRGFCMAFAGGAGRGCGFLKDYMRILRGLQSTAPGIVRRSPCSGAARSFMARRPFLGRCRCSGGAAAGNAAFRQGRRRGGRARGVRLPPFRSMPFRSMPFGLPICAAGVRPPVRAFFCVSPCHAAQSMV